MSRESPEKQEPTADFWKLHVIFIGFFFLVKFVISRI